MEVNDKLRLREFQLSVSPTTYDFATDLSEYQVQGVQPMSAHIARQVSQSSRLSVRRQALPAGNVAGEFRSNVEYEQAY